MFCREALFGLILTSLMSMAATCAKGNPAPAITPASDSAATQCAISKYVKWVREQSRPLDHDLKAKKLLEIDQLCGSSLHLANVVTAYDALPGTTSATDHSAAIAGPAASSAPVVTNDHLFLDLVNGPLDKLAVYLARPAVDVNERQANSESLLDIAADRNDTAVIYYLLDHGAEVEASPGPSNRYHGMTALHHAAFLNSIAAAELLISRGAKVNSYVDSYGSHTATPLCAAASQGHLQMAVLLLSHGAQVDAEFGVHQTPLSEALAHGHMEVVRTLIDHGAKLKPQYLAATAMQGRVEATKLLLTLSVDQTTKDSALRFAILGGPDHSTERILIVQDLLDHGANIDNLQSVPDVIPVMFASTTEMAEYLFAHGANRQAKLRGAQIAQAFACNDHSQDPVGMLQVLIAYGIDISGSPRQGSALDCATRRHDSAMLAFLRQHGAESAQPVRPISPTPLATPADTSPSKVTITRNGNITAMTMAGQLAPKNPVGCVSLSSLDKSTTPPDLYLGVAACVKKSDYPSAAALFALAGIESRFDAERVADKSAGQAGQVLIMGTFDAMEEDKRKAFQKAATELSANPVAMASICTAIEKIGYPTYYPEYMVLHGIQAFTGKAGDPTLTVGFDPPATWNFLLTNYLTCHDVPAAAHVGVT